MKRAPLSSLAFVLIMLGAVLAFALVTDPRVSSLLSH